jgi:hypothetical protein
MAKASKSYSKFTLEDLIAMGFSIENDALFKGVVLSPIEPSSVLKTILERAQQKNVLSEKAKSEKIIAPILDELEEINNRSFATFSGYQFNVDKAMGLSGFCDFILSRKPKSILIEAPIFCVVEAKNDNLDEGIAQCIAEMYASHLFNQKHKQAQTVIYGAVTFGFQWKFLQLIEKEVKIDYKIYYLNELPQLFGVLNYIVNL